MLKKCYFCKDFALQQLCALTWNETCAGVSTLYVIL